MAYHAPDHGHVQELTNIAHRIRINSVKATCASNSGHPTSAASCAEALAVLFFRTMKYHPNDPRNPNDDRFVMSKGHACPGLYSAWYEAGHITEKQLLSLRKIDSDIEGHPTPRLDFIDVATGSLGQGLSMSAGMAYVGKYLEKAKYRVFCLLGDGEMAEGSVWEALSFSSHYGLDNLVAIIDVNRLGQSEPTQLQHNMDTYRKRIDAFGWNAIVVDGHAINDLCKAFHEAEICKGKPTCVIMKTYKGKDIIGQEDLENFHGKPVTAGDKNKILNHLEGLLKTSGCKLSPSLPEESVEAVDTSPIKLCSPPNYSLGEKVATRKAYGAALAKIGKNNDRVISLDGDTKNSTFALDFKKAFPGSPRFVECFIAEQNLVGVAIGAETRRRTVPFCSTFAAFFTRTFDQIRMGAVSQTNVNFVGSHAGISIGPDGPSQMALEDLAMFRTIPGSTVFYPSDAVSCERAIELCANTKGVCFVRTGRPSDPVIYNNDEQFAIGKAKVVAKGSNDKVTVVGAGVTLHEAMAAQVALQNEGIGVRVIDPFTLKPLDRATIMEAAQATGGRIITVEDHYPEGGLGGAVAEALSDVGGIFHHRMAVNAVPRSGTGAELMKMFKIDSSAICDAVRSMLQ